MLYTSCRPILKIEEKLKKLSFRKRESAKSKILDTFMKYDMIQQIYKTKLFPEKERVEKNLMSLG